MDQGTSKNFLRVQILGVTHKSIFQKELQTDVLSGIPTQGRHGEKIDIKRENFPKRTIPPIAFILRANSLAGD